MEVHRIRKKCPKIKFKKVNQRFTLGVTHAFGARAFEDHCWKSKELVDVTLVCGDGNGQWKSCLVESAQIGPKYRQH